MKALLFFLLVLVSDVAAMDDMSQGKDIFNPFNVRIEHCSGTWKGVAIKSYSNLDLAWISVEVTLSEGIKEERQFITVEERAIWKNGSDDGSSLSAAGKMVFNKIKQAIILEGEEEKHD